VSDNLMVTLFRRNAAACGKEGAFIHIAVALLYAHLHVPSPCAWPTSHRPKVCTGLARHRVSPNMNKIVYRVEAQRPWLARKRASYSAVWWAGQQQSMKTTAATKWVVTEAGHTWAIGSGACRQP